MKFIHERPSLFLTQVFETSLENATAIRMGWKFENAALESWNETQTLGGYTLDEFLYDLALRSDRGEDIVYNARPTWLPFASLTHLSTCGSNSFTIATCCSGRIYSIACSAIRSRDDTLDNNITFWTTRHAYICTDNCAICGSIALANIVLWTWVPCSKSFWMT
jgi:hypothetical protein